VVVLLLTEVVVWWGKQVALQMLRPLKNCNYLAGVLRLLAPGLRVADLFSRCLVKPRRLYELQNLH